MALTEDSSSEPSGSRASVSAEPPPGNGTISFTGFDGQDATASAVLSDLADAALDLKCGSKSRIPPFVPHERDGSVLPLEEVVSRYYVRLNVVDKPGVFAKIAAVLAQAKIGISSIIQPEGHAGETVPVILMIHDAPNSSIRLERQILSQTPFDRWQAALDSRSWVSDASPISGGGVSVRLWLSDFDLQLNTLLMAATVTATSTTLPTVTSYVPEQSPVNW